MEKATLGLRQMENASLHSALWLRFAKFLHPNYEMAFTREPVV